MTPRGRPRSTKVDESVADAVRQLLDEVGYPGLSIDGVAARAGVGKAGIYRRWHSKAEMVFATVVHRADITPPPDRGSLHADLAELTGRVIALLSAPAARQALPGLLADVSADPALSARFTATFIHRERDVLAELLDRAVARGELSRRPDPAEIHAQLLGTVYAWLFLLRAAPPHDLAERVAGSVTAALRPSTKE